MVRYIILRIIVLFSDESVRGDEGASPAPSYCEGIMWCLEQRVCVCVCMLVCVCACVCMCQVYTADVGRG